MCLDSTLVESNVCIFDVYVVFLYYSNYLRDSFCAFMINVLACCHLSRTQAVHKRPGYEAGCHHRNDVNRSMITAGVVPGDSL